jgi:hypothetical protein
MNSVTWVPVWAMPNLHIDLPIEASHAALVPYNDERLRSSAQTKPALTAFLHAFRNEFGSQALPTIGMVREDAYRGVKTVTAFGGFRDAVSVSALAKGHALTMTSKGARGFLYSEVFDVYPWFLTPDMDGRITAYTPGLTGFHHVHEFRPQVAPAIPNRFLNSGDLDRPLLEALTARWERCFANGEERADDRRLFRALDMARAASKMPGGRDASEHDMGRAVALWVSAFEILAHDGVRSSPKQVLLLLGRVEWLRPTMKTRDRKAIVGGKLIETNLAGEIYGHLYRVRNDFLHGNRVDRDTAKLEKCQRPVLFFAAPLFRLALTAYLNLRSAEPTADATDPEQFAAQVVDGTFFRQTQRLMEDAILKAEETPLKAEEALPSREFRPGTS